MTRARRVDANQAEIVQALRDAGYSVLDLSKVGGGVPDLLVAGIDRATGTPQSWLLEVKTKSGVLEPAQMAFLMEWRGYTAVVRSIEEALRAVGAI